MLGATGTYLWADVAWGHHPRGQLAQLLAALEASLAACS
jgi:hypothetical protein